MKIVFDKPVAVILHQPLEYECDTCFDSKLIMYVDRLEDCTDCQEETK